MKLRTKEKMKRSNCERKKDLLNLSQIIIIIKSFLIFVKIADCRSLFRFFVLVSLFFRFYSSFSFPPYFYQFIFFLYAFFFFFFSFFLPFFLSSFPFLFRDLFFLLSLFFFLFIVLYSIPLSTFLVVLCKQCRVS